MIQLEEKIIEKLHSLPEVYLREIFDFVEFLNQKYKKMTDTEFLKNINGMSESIAQGRKEKVEDCKTLEDMNN